MYPLSRVGLNCVQGSRTTVELSCPLLLLLLVPQGVGAVASRRAAELYGLDILDADIQDAKDNVTRFIKLARSVAVPGSSARRAPRC
jgi:hypothetical protein